MNGANHFYDLVSLCWVYRCPPARFWGSWWWTRMILRWSDQLCIWSRRLPWRSSIYRWLPLMSHPDLSLDVGGCGKKTCNFLLTSYKHVPFDIVGDTMIPSSVVNKFLDSSLTDFPQNTQMAAHIKEFLKDGYRVSAEAVEVKFATGDGSRSIYDGSVGISDGFCKLLIMVGITLICGELEPKLNLKVIFSLGYRL